MKFCSRCGNQLLDAAVMCPKCGCIADPLLYAQLTGQMPYSQVPNAQVVQQATVYPQSAEQQVYSPPVPPCASTPPTATQYGLYGQSAPIQPIITQEYRNVTPPAGSVTQHFAAPTDYSIAVEKAVVTNIIASVLLAVSAVVWYCWSIFDGAALALAAEIVALIPNTKLTNMIKRDPTVSKQQTKAIRKKLKQSHRAFTMSFILAIIALVCVIFYFAFLDLILPIFL